MNCCPEGATRSGRRPRTSLVFGGQIPNYAIELTPSFFNTQGGPRRDRNAQILDTNRKPIPRLYSAGEMGSVFSFHYQGGGNVAECLAFGRIAAERAAAEKPWA
jgi:succinate dehydrogenase/fumarate reductase flavoprotein subunit